MKDDHELPFRLGIYCTGRDWLDSGEEGGSCVITGQVDQARMRLRASKRVS